MSDTVERALHAILAPSKANTWARCLGALRLCRDMPAEPPNEWAASGTCTWVESSRANAGVPVVDRSIHFTARRSVRPSIVGVMLVSA